MNTTKTIVLMVGLTVLLVFIGGAIGGRQGMIYAFIFAAVMNLFSYWFSDKIVLRMYNAREVTENEAPVLWNVTHTLAMKMNMPMPKVYVIPSDAPNAFATGRNPRHAAVCATEGILQILDRREMRAVLGHELSHVYNRDILISSVAATLAAAITYIAQFALFFGGGNDDRDRNPFVGLIMLILAPIAAGLIQLAISRSREYQADQSGAVLSDDPLALASALRKLQAGTQALPLPQQPALVSTSHLMIANPFRGQGMASLFSTHPPMEQRIARLEKLAKSDPRFWK